MSIASDEKSRARVRKTAVGIPLAIALLPLSESSYADVYNCSSGQVIEYRDTPCPNGKNLSRDPSISAALEASGPRTFFEAPVTMPEYTPLRSDSFSHPQAVQFLDRVARACESHDINAFYSTFAFSLRWAFNKKGQEELADRMQWYCSNDYAPAQLAEMRSAGDFSVLPTGRTERGVVTSSLCWTPPGGDNCAFNITAAVEGGIIVRDEF